MPPLAPQALPQPRPQSRPASAIAERFTETTSTSAQRHPPTHSSLPGRATQEVLTTEVGRVCDAGSWYQEVSHPM
ncbi:hypothetical protein SKAU_G00126240 [Synaphobranchus kaupii]|uniref:Uncharacterized protein n=1 Tax=Synaphobranchus kaupii TaxID=118154 RepID=A0A9Q1FPP5_SYNKA|nr:hypothetical protein SKAU_G00126240 [Synaphobranchus kaupii]